MFARRSTLALALLAGLACLFDSPPLAAQQQSQQGITLQLPTFSFFSVATTVVVPDSGGAYMGGMRRASSGRNRFGSPLTRGQGAIGCERQAANLHVHAQIHDLDGMDKALRGSASPVLAKSSPLAQRLAAAQAANNARPLASLQDLQKQRAAAADAQQADAADYLRRGKEAQLAGKTSLARTYYQMALRRASGALRDEIAAMLGAE
jgi:hypothetical protein